MKTLIKWTIRAAVMFSAILLLLYLTGQVKVSFGVSLLILLFVSFGLGIFFYLIEEKYFPVRKRKMIKKLEELFSAESTNESAAKFKVGKFDVIANVEFKLSLNEHSTQGEVIGFHVPRAQLENIKLDKPLSQIEDSIDELLTYRIYQTNGLGLKLAKKRIQKNLE